MTKILVQFHADPTELVNELLPAWLDGFDLHVAWEQAVPQYSVTRIAKSELVRLDVHQVFRLALSLQPLDVARPRASS